MRVLQQVSDVDHALQERLGKSKEVQDGIAKSLRRMVLEVKLGEISGDQSYAPPTYSCWVMYSRLGSILVLALDFR